MMEKKTDKASIDENQDELDVSAPEGVELKGNGEEATQISDLALQLEKAQRDLLYARAEFDNHRKRLLRDAEQTAKFANERIVRELLGTVDLFDRGIGFASSIKSKNSGDSEVTNFVSGMELTHRELIQLLNRFGVEFIGEVGEKFDPAKHEAISQQETTEDKNGLVLQVFQRGALLNGRLLTPARVIVGIMHN